MGSAGTTPHKIKVTLDGQNIGLWWDGQLKFSVTDTVFVAATKVGLRFANPYDYTSRYDNFTVEPPPCSASVTPGALPINSSGGTFEVGVGTAAWCGWGSK